MQNCRERFALLPSQEFDYLLFFRETANLMFGKDSLAVGNHVENTSAAFD
jgi:hypothetical protein